MKTGKSEEKKEVKKKAATPKKAAAPKAKKEPAKKIVHAAPKAHEEKPKKKIEKTEKPKAVEHAHAVAPKVVTVHPEKVEKVELVIKPAERAHVFKKKPAKVARFHASGGRKTSQARVWLSYGKGKFTINGKTYEQYASNRLLLTKMCQEPFVLTNTVGKFDVKADVSGGGIVGQVGAVRQAVSKAISIAEPSHRTILRRLGLLTRDPRVKERKKYGQKKARKRFQYSKR
jgi:small subunit ribosomal protein S9